MRIWKILTTAILAITAIALTTASVFAYMGRPGYYTPYTTSTGTTGTYGTYSSGTGPYGTYGRGMMGGGMMGGYGYYAEPPVTAAPPQTNTPSTTTPTTPTYPYQYGGGGCGGMRARLGYAAPSTYTSSTTASQLNISTAVAIAQNFLTSTGNTDLVLSQVEEYTLNFYVIVKEKDTGFGAFELLIDKYSGAVYPEYGLNMMWNTKYGMHNGLMGWLTGTTTAPTTVTAEQAKANAQQYLNVYYPGTTVSDAQAFYGYYHVEVLSSGKVYGMLSVNSYSGQVWYHNWHGTFIQEIELS
jgi:hypothetical protein